ncbi:DNA gyrase subunit A [Candidatus Woesebacteria bacterium RIFCSPHIGHO2_01_FULL_41_10]|uniref:DNA gyrase subunit A n=1 Tax=Candidatus Woesebacteria bacterium RIFCSPHIGHO2_01_FULL_41_10 TaxID=1802500 RepID=A0A1F7YP08_9BACT|nr:MAG: DNA gyrase subunit A [Candidatus Woesebacteria bacterium RIFCSPHIGHO2_01_FULL_41_10]
MILGKILPVEITEELSKSYLDYAMSVIVARALPDVRDGLKPVHRRILYAMHLMGLHASSKHSKSAKVVGEVLGKYHPHGDGPVYDALVRLAQDFSMRYPLVNGQGNFGSVDGDPPAAMRYTEVKLAAICEAMLVDIEKRTVDYTENFDATLKEPLYLPALLPNLLLMGSEGIAVGMATKIPPHNLSEVVDGVIATIKQGKPVIEENKIKEEVDYFISRIDKIAAGEAEEIEDSELTRISATFESDITIAELVKHIPGPDFPTGGSIFDASSMVDVYSTGRGKIVVRGIAEIKDGPKGRSKIEITEIPYQVNKAKLVQDIAELVRNKKIKGIAALRDESDKDGMGIVIELKREARPKSVLNNIYKHTKLQTSFPANFVALVGGTPHTINLKQIIVEYVKHRQLLIIRRTIFELTSAKKRAHILEGLKIALDNLDEVIKTIRASRTQEDAKSNLISKFGLSAIQATAILDMQLRRLAALEREKLEKEYEEIMKTIDRLIAILRTPSKILEIITTEIKGLKEKYADERRTRIFKQNVGEFNEEDLVPKTDTLITVTKTGYVKRVPRGIYKAQRRGGKGVLGMSTKEEDEIDHLVSATTHDLILFFTDKGRVFGARAWEIPESSRQSKGQALVNFINLDQGEQIQSINAMHSDTTDHHLMMATAHGVVKKTTFSEFSNLKANGLIAIRLKSNDRLVSVRETTGNDHIMIVTLKGKAIRFHEKDARAMGRATSGVKGISISADDEVISMLVFSPEHAQPQDKRKKSFRDILVISKHGIGKRTATHLFPVQKRAGKGVKVASITTKTGELAAAILVTQEINQIIITSKYGQIIKLPVRNIPEMGRSTQGVILMRFAKSGDTVAAFTALEQAATEDTN